MSMVSNFVQPRLWSRKLLQLHTHIHGHTRTRDLQCSHASVGKLQAVVDSYILVMECQSCGS